jgi:hypothetical protein
MLRSPFADGEPIEDDVGERRPRWPEQPLRIARFVWAVLVVVVTRYWGCSFSKRLMAP